MKKRAILSVSDKTGIVDFARELVDLGFKIYSTGGTLKTLKDNDVKVSNITKLTQFPEVFDGRVKTLNPMVHGGILYRRDKKEDRMIAKDLGIKAIDLVCVNLYPFKATIERTDDFEEIIENIDIGGPTMVRSAAKNFQDVLIVTDNGDFKRVVEALRYGTDTYEFRRDLMIKAYEHTAAYDGMIANYMNKRFKNGQGDKHFITGTKVQTLRYGENPHQQGALYQFDEFYSKNLRVIKGEPSFNNLTDIHGAVKIAASFGDRPAVCIVKHGNPCGFAVKEDLLTSYTEALRCDPVSAYGGVVAVNGTVDEALAQKMNEIFIEVIIAPRITPEAVAVFEAKKRIKLFELGLDKTLKLPDDPVDFKHVAGGFVLQNPDSVAPDEVAHAKKMGELEATKEQMTDLEVAYKVAALTKSNCVVYVKNGATVAIGMGMTSRVDAAKAALRKAEDLGIDVAGAALASEAFFPFRDSIDAAAEAGVAAIIEPGGSIRDDDVIAAANEHGIAIYFTGVRHFLH